MNKDISSKLFNFGISVFSIIIVAAILFLSQDCHFWGDDVEHSTYTLGEKLFDCLQFGYNPYEGGYIGHFFSKFFSFKLPLLFNLHPQDFMSYGHGTVIGIFLIIILVSICKFSQIYKKKNILFFSTYIFSFTFFLYAVFSSHSTVISTHYLFYRYCFPLLFFSIFVFYIFKNIFHKKKKIKFSTLTITSISAYIIGTSSELMIVISTLLCLILILYNISANIIYKFKKNKEFLKKYVIKLNANVYIPFLCLLVCPIFHSTIMRGTNDPIKNISLAYSISFESLKEFTYYYFHILFKMDYILWTFIIISFFIVFYIANKKREIKKILLSAFLLFSILATYYSLYFCGETGTLLTIPECKFYISHCNIRFLFKILLLYPLFMNISYIWNKSKKINYFILSCLILSSIVLIVYSTIRIAEDYSFLHSQKRNSYISEKIIRFYNIKNQTAYIPSINLEFTIFIFGFFDKNKCTYVSEYKNYYYDSVYKTDASFRMICRVDNGIQKFYEAGGIFTPEELNNIRFERLYNEDFVANKLYEDFLFTRNNNYFILPKNGISFSNINFNNNLL